MPTGNFLDKLILGVGTIETAGVPLPFQSTLNFVDATVVNNIAKGTTDVIIGDGPSPTIVSTTDATWTTAVSIPLADATTMVVQAYAVARKSNGTSAYFAKQMAYQRAGGAPSAVGGSSNDDLGSRPNSTSWGVQIIASGNNLVVQVQGASATSLSWAVIDRALFVAL